MEPVRFVVRAQVDPQTLPRLINYVAQLGMAPTKVRAEATEGRMSVMIEQAGLTDDQAGLIAEKMRSSMLVEEVRLTRGRRVLRPNFGNE